MEKLQELADKITAAGGEAVAVPLDVTDDAQIEGLFTALRQHWDGLDGLVHSIAYAPTEALDGDFLDGFTREAFRISQEVSAASFPLLDKAARPMMKGRNGSLLTLTYLGAVRTMPNYNVMGMAKASLEATVRYLAYNLGPDGTRVNAISAGPIKTLAAKAIAGTATDDAKQLNMLNEYWDGASPIGWDVEDPTAVAKSICALLSDWLPATTGSIVYVDGGASHNTWFPENFLSE